MLAVLERGLRGFVVVGESEGGSLVALRSWEIAGALAQPGEAGERIECRSGFTLVG